MKIKVKFYDRKLRSKYIEVVTLISLFCSFVFIVITIPDNLKLPFGIGLFVILLILYLMMWRDANTLKKATLSINNSTLVIKTGDIFEENGLKVIAFNEYFDTQVDNRIIAATSLNGIYIKTKINDVSDLDNQINTDPHLNENILLSNENRAFGKKKRYRLGTIFEYNDYLLTAFTKFDNDNKAYLHMNDFINFLLNFWNEIDRIYAGRSVSIPLMGSGMTRLREYPAMPEQELLELLIWSFKVSRIKFTYPSKVSIIIHDSMKDKINFYKL